MTFSHKIFSEKHQYAVSELENFTAENRYYYFLDVEILIQLWALTLIFVNLNLGYSGKRITSGECILKRKIPHRWLLFQI